MDCIIKVQLSSYNTETGKYEPQLTEIGKATEEETVSMDKVVEMIATLSKEDRSALAAAIVKAKQQTLTASMIKNNQFVGNTTVQELLDRHNLAQVYKINPDLYTNYTIIQASNFSLNNINYNGRVVTPDGRELFIIKDVYGATAFVKYLQAKEMAERAFAEDGIIPEDIQPLLEDLDAIAKAKKLSRKDTVIAYLNDRDSIKPFVSGGKPITPRQVLGKIVASLTGEYNFDDNFTDLELAIKGIKKKVSGKNKYNWILPKKRLYDLLQTYYPDLKAQISETQFQDMSTSELQEFLTGPNGIFRGHPKLDRAIVSESTKGSRTVKMPDTPTSIISKQMPKAQVKQVWDIIVQQAADAGIELASKFSEYEKLDPESMVKVINSGKFQVEINGVQANVVAKLVSSANGSKRVYYNYEYEVVNEPTVTETESDITLSFPYSSLGEVYNFGYKTQYMFLPVHEGPVQYGQYNGMYLYKAQVNGKQVFAISRNIISPNSYMATYPTLESAIRGVDDANANDKIGANGLIEIKQVDGVPRTVNIEMERLKEGQIVTVLDIKLPKVDVNKLPGSIKQMLGLTVPELQARLSDIPDIAKINTPEKAAAFLVQVSQLFNRADTKAAESVKNLGTIFETIASSDYAEGVAKIIADIDSSVPKSYFVEKLVVPKASKGLPRKIATLRLLENNGTTINTEGTKVGDISVDTFISQTMDNAINFFKTQYNIDIESLTRTELEEFSKAEGLNLESKLDSIKAFIYNGKIYINTSNAKSSDLYHEIAHIFLGVLKAQYPDGYRQLISQYTAQRHFKKKLNWMASKYENFAQQDLYEEAVVDMIADNLMSDGVLAEGFNQGRFVELMSEIMNKVDAFKHDFGTFMSKEDTRANGLGFNAFMGQLISSNSDTLKRQRILTNFVQQMIAEHKISEINC